ncbi:cupin domain-containing protein [Streptomyces reniochalinae]|uniref:Cupin domain-containing protein n=1 Tax=Streptomyces reniochalinae TaxID=2250578 RepID=A0A367EHF5_9ACTN|nr:cupin domain-containing protein [Streptomyces reniochalinae]RCG17528.1 cupin domain-containing protein [Streptomyces reniochalinae]
MPEEVSGQSGARNTTSEQPAGQEFYAQLAKLSAEARWTVEPGPWSPKPASVPMHWKYAELRPFALESASFVKSDDAALRVVSLINPGHPERGAAVGHLYTGLQMLNGGEAMTAHRHAASAMRFVIEGDGAWTTIAGDRLEVGARDLVVTPSRLWHEHGSGTEPDADPVIWQDATNDPLVDTLGANFFELLPERRQAARPVTNSTLYEHGHGMLKPDGRRASRYSPLLMFPWEKTYEALHALAKVSDGSPYDGIFMEYVNPSTGGPVLPTMSAHMQLLRPGEATLAHRHTGSVVYQVAKGRGHSVVAGRRFDWQQNDIFCVPSWAWHEHANDDGSDDACLFSFDDFPTLNSLGLYVEEPLTENGGRQ